MGWFIAFGTILVISAMLVDPEGRKIIAVALGIIGAISAGLWLLDTSGSLAPLLFWTTPACWAAGLITYKI